MDDEGMVPPEIFPKLGTGRLFRHHHATRIWRHRQRPVHQRPVLQAFSRWNHALGLSWVAHENLCANNIYRNANDAQRRKYLPASPTAR